MQMVLSLGELLSKTLEFEFHFVKLPKSVGWLETSGAMTNLQIYSCCIFMWTSCVKFMKNPNSEIS